MSESNIDIKFKDHFKLSVSLKDKIQLESELIKEDIKFYQNIEEETVGSQLRYLFLDADRDKIDKLLIQNRIVAFNESSNIGNFKEHKSFFAILIIVVVITLPERVSFR